MKKRSKSSLNSIAFDNNNAFKDMQVQHWYLIVSRFYTFNILLMKMNRKNINSHQAPFYYNGCWGMFCRNKNSSIWSIFILSFQFHHHYRLFCASKVLNKFLQTDDNDVEIDLYLYPSIQHVLSSFFYFFNIPRLQCIADVHPS